jgi:predicted DNA-binding transcriptional regulator AlpA
VSEKPKRILRVNVVAERLGCSRATLYRLEGAGLLPPRIIIGPGASGWLEADIDRFIDERPRAQRPLLPLRPRAAGERR